MKYIKTYENDRLEFKREDIIIRGEYDTSLAARLFIVTENCYKNEYINVIKIGTILGNQDEELHAKPEIYSDVREIMIINDYIRNINDLERNLFFNALIENNNFKPQKRELIENIKKESGIDIFKTEEYKKYTMEKDISKYNL